VRKPCDPPQTGSNGEALIGGSFLRVETSFPGCLRQRYPVCFLLIAPRNEATPRERSPMYPPISVSPWDTGTQRAAACAAALTYRLSSGRTLRLRMRGGFGLERWTTPTGSSERVGDRLLATAR
jgi:hypothetical protein